MASIFMTGASGYIGRALSARLAAAGHRVQPCPWRMEAIPAAAIDADVVLHLAAAGGGSRYIPRAGADNPARIAATNVAGIERLLAGIARRDSRIVFFSTNAVYPHRPVQRLLSEDEPTAPGSTYGRSKLEAEQRLRESGRPVTVLRLSSVCGENGDGNSGSSFLNVVIQRALREGVIDVVGDDPLIDPLYLEDLSRAVESFCLASAPEPGVYHVAGRALPIGELLQGLARLIVERGLPCELHETAARPLPPMVLSTGKLEQATGWRASAPGDYLGKLLDAHHSPRPRGNLIR